MNNNQQSNSADSSDLEVLVRSNIAIIIIETVEEKKAIDLLLNLSFKLTIPLFKWTITNGLNRIDLDLSDPGLPPESKLHKPVEVFEKIREARKPVIFALTDFHPFLDDPVHIRLLKDVALNHDQVGHTLVLISHKIEVPPELDRFTARIQLALPDREQIETIIREEARRWLQANRNARLSVDQSLFDQLVTALQGIPENNVRQLARSAIVNDGAITPSDVPRVMQAKFDLLGKGGVLSFEYETARFADVGGLSKLKQWLHIRSAFFIGDKGLPKLDPPKGILLLGVQGCGKSLAAKTVAGVWKVPLLRLDFGRLYNRFHGETERNIRESLATAEVMEPCVLWIDEIEKGIGTNDTDGGTSGRVLGTFLTWMAENKKRVFIVATANDIDSLPPELLRKGRLDEIFFVDLPDQQSRKNILEIHLTKRNIDCTEFDLPALSEQCEGFSGAEIEQAIVAGLYAAHANQTALNQQQLMNEFISTRPLSVV
ncbi:MAG TPA: AAA family ATPase, partial [Crenotrichaceae bacterium]|nr:AAA family ATPase [Crenotrichaceae bacterium]